MDVFKIKIEDFKDLENIINAITRIKFKGEYPNKLNFFYYKKAVVLDIHEELHSNDIGGDAIFDDYDFPEESTIQWHSVMIKNNKGQSISVYSLVYNLNQWDYRGDAEDKLYLLSVKFILNTEHVETDIKVVVPQKEIEEILMKK